MKGKILKYWNSLNKKKKILLSIIVCLTLVEVSSLFLMYQSLINKNSLLDSVSLKNLDNSNGMFAIYIEQEDGSYTNSEEIPSTETHEYNPSKSGCIDSNGQDLGNVLTYDVSNNMISAKVRGTAKCFIYFTLFNGDIEVSVNTDGKTGLPTSSGYKANLTCDTSNAIFNEKYQRIEISGVSSDENSCSLNYTKVDTSGYTLLIDEVESKATGTIQFGNYTNLTTLTQSEYGTISVDITYGSATNTNVLDFDGTQWVSNSNVNYKSDYEYKTTISSPGFYQICYTLENGDLENRLKIRTNKGNMFFEDAYWAGEDYLMESNSGCLKLEYLEAGDYVIVEQDHDATSSTSMSTVKFYLQKSNTLLETHYRYVEPKSNNFVWFNNEMWRIIGSIPAKVDSSGNTENLIKIIRTEPLEVKQYSSDLLNNYYYGKKDGTNLNVCSESSSSKNIKSNCDYNRIGIEPKSLYGQMVKDVYGNTKSLGDDYDYVRFFQAFNIEKKTQTLNSKIEIMNISDYLYVEEFYPYNNWLYGQANEKAMSQCISYRGSDYFCGSDSYIIRPVLFLDSSVYIINGTGTESDPYIIGM